MNAHALAALTTRQPETHPITEEWIAHTAAVTLACSALDGIVRSESMNGVDQDRYIQELRRITHDHDVLLLLEVVTGFRVGLTGAEGYFDIKPDLSVWGKSIANGYPAAAVTGRAEIMDFIGGGSDHGDFMGTFSVAATMANLELLRETGESGYTDMHQRGQRFADATEDIADDTGHNVYIPEFIGYSHVFFHDGETNPDTWTEWRDVEKHKHFDQWCRFAKGMIDEGIYGPATPCTIQSYPCSFGRTY